MSEEQSMGGQAMTDEPLTLVPDWSHGCDNCGQRPTVTGTDSTGQVAYDAGMCGPCTWGEADTIDPGNW